MATMQEMLAKLRAKTNNPAGAAPVINIEKAIQVQETKDPIPEKSKSNLTKDTKLGFELREKLLNLETMLLEKHPAMPGLLREIHVALRKQPENVVLLNEDEIRVIVMGLEKQTGVELASCGVKQSKSAVGKAKAAKLSSDDLGL